MLRTSAQGERAPRPLAEADLDGVCAVFTDVDGTLTIGGRLTSEAIAALESLDAAGLPVVLVTGRPAGFAECWVRTLPVAGAIAENGGLWFHEDAKGRIRKRWADSPERRKSDRLRLRRIVERTLARFPGARLSADSAYTEVDLAIDWAEEAQLGERAVDRIEAELRRKGVHAVRSSVHVNCWLGEFDKLKAARRFCREVWKRPLAPESGAHLYVGDSFNDAPMFAAFRLSVGVGNVKDILDRLPSPPRFVTEGREGHGFIELAEALLARRPRHP